MHPQHGPLGSDREIFQTNFAFGRAVRLQAQNVHPGYWQSAHPDVDGYRPDQIMRYSEGNLNRLQIVGELHVKSGKVLEVNKVPELDTPLDISLLGNEASWENRGQMSRTSARDFVEALLLDVHHAQYLSAHPHVTIRQSLLQDQLLGDAEATLQRHGARATLDRLKREARTNNLDVSQGRIKSDWIEPETIFWEAWKVMPGGEKADLAREVIGGFLERVQQAASMDTRREWKNDPMEWHRHRIHPVLWHVLETDMNSHDKLYQEYTIWKTQQSKYQARRPKWSQLPESVPPWDYLK